MKRPPTVSGTASAPYNWTIPLKGHFGRNAAKVTGEAKRTNCIMQSFSRDQPLLVGGFNSSEKY